MTMAAQFREREAEAWRDLTSAEYDRVLCATIEQLGAAPDSAERVEALLALASATLRRDASTLTESRACCAEHLLALVAEVPDPALHLRIRLLLLLAWLALGAVARRGPDFISTKPELPPGVILPTGADPDEIADPALRERAREASKRHGEAVEQWNAKQRALGHLNRLAALVDRAGPDFKDDEDAGQEFAAAISLAAASIG